jgi:hypothetical protein
VFDSHRNTQFDDDRLGSRSKENSVTLPLPLVSGANIQEKQNKQDRTRPNDFCDRVTELSIKKKAPPATHHRAMMSLSMYVLLYDMQLHTSTNLQDILKSSSKAERVMLVTAVAVRTCTLTD